MSKRILVVVNKQWEADPLLAVLCERKATPAAFRFMPLLSGVGQNSPPVPVMLPVVLPINPLHDRATLAPRCVIDLGSARAEVWCLEDWIPVDRGSSTAAKVTILPRIFSWASDGGTAPHPDVVVAVGTAGFVGDASMNGSVVIGTRAFLHDAFRDRPNPDSPWTDARVGKPLSSTFDFRRWARTLESLRFQAEKRFVLPPMSPSADPVVLAAANYTAVSVVNVTNYDDYAWADSVALEAFHAADSKSPVGSVETTHGLIRLQSDAPFLFVSSITDREGRFNVEVGTRTYAQNFACSHNGGVALAWLLPSLAAFLEAPPA